MEMLWPELHSTLTAKDSGIILKEFFLDHAILDQQMQVQKEKFWDSLNKPYVNGVSLGEKNF